MENTGVKCPSCGFVNIQGEDRCAECFYTLMQRDLPEPLKHDQIQTAMMTAPVSELLTGKDLLVASSSDPIKKIIKVFQDKQKRCVLVYDHRKLVGIVSERDIFFKLAGKDSDLSKIKVEEVMTPNPEHVSADAPIAYVVNKMAMGGFRHVPVLASDGTPLSIITIKDVMGYLRRRDKTPSS